MTKPWPTLILFLTLFTSFHRVSLANKASSKHNKKQQNGKFTTEDIVDKAASSNSAKTRKRLDFYTETPGGLAIAVIDDILGDKTLNSLKQHASEHCDWTFARPSICNSRFCNQTEKASSRYIPWLSQVLKSDRKVSILAELLSQVISKYSKLSTGRRLAARNTKINVLQRGDFSLVRQEVDEANHTICTILFLTRTWNKNDYGEVLFYGEDGEVFKSVHPRFGRLVVFDGSIPIVQRAPAMHIQRDLLSILVTFDVLKKTEDKATKQELEEKKPEAVPFVGQDSQTPPRTVRMGDVSKYVTREYKTSDGLKVVVFDDVMSKEDTDALRLYMTTQTVFQYAIDMSESSDNVRWVTGWDPAEFVKSRYWGLLRPLVNHVSGTDSYYPYDVSLNLIRSYDNSQNHRDCEDENCPTCRDYTLLVYLNPDWSGDLHGETVFYDSNGEMLVAVRPRYGRVAMFRGKIWHSARPPTSTFKDARLTFAVKFKSDKKTAVEFMDMN